MGYWRLSADIPRVDTATTLPGRQGCRRPCVFHNKGFRALMKAFYPPKNGRFVGWGFKDLWGAVMHVYAIAREFLACWSPR